MNIWTVLIGVKKKVEINELENGKKYKTTG